jgi:hypothetical protein
VADGMKCIFTSKETISKYTWKEHVNSVFRSVVAVVF